MKLQRLDLGAPATAAAWIGARVAIALGDGAVLAAAPGGEAQRIEVHDGAVLCAARHPDGTRLVTGGDDGKIQLVSAEGEVDTLLDARGKWVSHLAASAISGVIAAGVGKQAIIFKDDREQHRFDYPSSVGGLALDVKGRRLAASHYGGATLHYALIADDKGVSLKWAGSHLAITLAPDADYLFTAMQENEIHGWRLADKTDMRMSGYAAKTRSFSWDRRGRWLATSGADCAVVWPFAGKAGPQGKPPATLAARPAMSTCVAFHPSQERLAVGFDDGAAFLVDLAAPQEVIALDEPGDGPVSALAWSEDGAHLAIADDGGRGAIFSFDSI